MKTVEVSLVYILSGLFLVTVAVLGSLFFSPLSPHNASNLELAEYYFSDGAGGVYGAYDRGKAKKYYLAALAERPELADRIEYQIGRLEFLDGNLSAAIQRFEGMLLKYHDSVPEVYYMLGLTYGYRAQWHDNANDWQQAEENFATFMHRSPAAPWPRVDLAWIYFSQGKYEEMKPILEEGLEFEPDNAWLLNMYGLALLNTGNHEQAELQFQKALEEIKTLNQEEWGQVYPGNHPSSWSEGLEKTKELIERNLILSQERA